MTDPWALIAALTNPEHPNEVAHYDTWGPMEQDEQGGCVWCGDEPRPNQSKRAIDSHNPDCPWTQARRALRDRTETG